MPDSPSLQVLIVEPDPAGGSLLHQHVDAFGYRARQVRTAEESLLWLASEDIGVVVFRLTRDDTAALQQVRAIRALAAGAEVVLVATQNAIPTAAEAVRLGAHAFVVEPYRLDTLEVAILKAFEVRGLQDNAARLHALTEHTSIAEFIGAHPGISRLRADAARVAPTDTPVLITGEWGVGRALLAECLHRNGDRAGRPWCVVECAGETEQTLGAALFGLGARDGAAVGVLEAASGGTVLLRNVHALSPTLQAALARVLETREVQPLEGGPRRPTDVRVLTTGPTDITSDASAGVLRTDLFYRLNTVTFYVPPLRDRLEDLPELVRYFLERSAHVAGPPAVHDAVLELFSHYAWPGNVWELRLLVERAAVLAAGRTITLVDVPVLTGRETPASAPLELHAPLRLLDVERGHIERVLLRYGGNKTRAARALGITTKTLYNKLRRYGHEAAAGTGQAS